jgi:DNA mismatch endonuclease (patch repair protein)
VTSRQVIGPSGRTLNVHCGFLAETWPIKPVGLAARIVEFQPVLNSAGESGISARGYSAKQLHRMRFSTVGCINRDAHTRWSLFAGATPFVGLGMAKAKLFTNDPSEVSARMKLIRGRNTKPELALFSILRTAEIPFRSHVRIGRVEADAMLSNDVLVFVDSPFWHLRKATDLKRLSLHWRERLLRNKRRDDRQRRHLRKLGYSVIRLWADQIKTENVLSRINRILNVKAGEKR